MTTAHRAHGLSIVAAALAIAPAGAQDRPAAESPPTLARSTVLSTKLHAQSATAPLAVAHRGASAAYPENTLPAFRAALAAGAPMVELDFRETSDGVLVVLHDKTLDRTTDSETVLQRKKVRVDSASHRELRDLDAGSWKDARFAGTRIPTLEESLELIQPKSVTMIEHKSGKPETLVALLRKLDLVESVLVQSFDWGWLEAVHRLEPKITIAALGEHAMQPAHFVDLRRTGASMVHWAARDLTLENVDELHRRGYLVCAYTLNNDVALCGGAALDLDAITTDRPERLLALQSRGMARRPKR